MKRTIKAADLFAPLPVNTAPEGVQIKLLSVSVPAELADGLERLAAAEDLTTEELMTYIIAEYLAEKNNGKLLAGAVPADPVIITDRAEALRRLGMTEDAPEAWFLRVNGITTLTTENGRQVIIDLREPEYQAEKNGVKPRKTAEKARKKRQEWKRLIFEYYNRGSDDLTQPTPEEYPDILAGLIDEMAERQEEAGIYWQGIRDDVRRLCMKYCLCDLDAVAKLKDDGSTDFYLSDFMADFVTAYNAGNAELEEREEKARERWQKENEERAKLAEEKRLYREAERVRILNGEAAGEEYNAKQAAAVLGVTPQTVIKRAKAGEINGKKSQNGQQWTFTGAALAKVLK